MIAQKYILRARQGFIEKPTEGPDKALQGCSYKLCKQICLRARSRTKPYAVSCRQGSGTWEPDKGPLRWLAGLLALFVNLESLAELVSVGTLFVFFCVCAGCLRRRYYEHGRSAPGPLITRLAVMTLLNIGASQPPLHRLLRSCECCSNTLL